MLRQGGGSACRPCWRLLSCLSGFALAAPGRDATNLATRSVAIPALVAPLSVCFPWTAVPSKIGITFGEFGFFLHWLTKYPTVGPVNHEVLLGILCVLGCGFMPWLSAVLRRHGNSGRAAHLVLAGLALIPYVPVLIRLDANLFLAGTYSAATAGAPIWVALGPVLRLAAILSIIGMLRHRPAG